MCECLCVYLSVYVYGWVSVFIGECLCVWVSVYVYGWVSMCMGECLYVWVSVDVYGWVSMCMVECPHVHGWVSMCMVEGYGQGSIIREIRGPLANIRESIHGIRQIFVSFANRIVSEFWEWKTCHCYAHNFLVRYLFSIKWVYSERGSLPLSIHTINLIIFNLEGILAHLMINGRLWATSFRSWVGYWTASFS
jgi:hypothetical protein